MTSSTRGNALVILMLAMLVCSCHAKIGFVKDQSMDAVFPGPVYRQAPSLPEGHMRPLGWQRRPDGPIVETSEMPYTKEFYEDYVSKNLPVVFRSGVSEAPAFTNWQEDTYLNEKYGQVNVTVKVRTGKKKDKVATSDQVMKVKKFLYDYMYDESYMATIIPRDMMDELPLPKCVRCGTISERLISAQLWMSSGGTSSKVHSHDHHLLHCVLFGRRDFIVIEGKHRKAFDFQEDYPGSLGGHSDMDTLMVNAFRFKQIARVPWTWASLYPADCVFVPAGYLHQVRSYGRSISVTVEFGTINEFDDSGCTLIEEEFVPLSDAFYLFTYENGRLRLSEDELDVYELRRILNTLMGKQEVLSQASFEHFYRQVLPEGDQVPEPWRVFNLMTSEEQESQITKRDLREIPDEVLQKIVLVFNSAMADDKKKKEDEQKQQRHSPKHEEF